MTGFHAVVRGSSAIDYDWNAVRGAAKYQIVVSRSPKWTKGLVRSVVGTKTRVSGLGAGTSYYAKVRALRADPARCVVVEDSLASVQAATAAGMRVLGYAPPRADTGPELADAGAELFTAMAQLPRLLGVGKV